MTTMALTVAAIRRILQDDPDSTTTAGSIAAAGTATVAVADIGKFAVGQTWEFDDDTGDTVLITAIADSTATITMRRGHRDSTAAAHSSGVVMLKDPRYSYDEISQAVNFVLDSDLYQEGIFDLIEHQITSSASTDHYNAPSTSCQKFLDVYQMPASGTEPQRTDLHYTPEGRNVDTTLYANGKYFVIQGNAGVPGTDLYYVTCAHKLTITTLTTSEERIVQLLGAAYVLEWTEPRRLGGPTNQGDETVRPGASMATAAYLRGLAEELMSKVKRELESTFPTPRRFVMYSKVV